MKLQIIKIYNNKIGIWRCGKFLLFESLWAKEDWNCVCANIYITGIFMHPDDINKHSDKELKWKINVST